MATAGTSRLVRNLKDEYLSCSICLDQYQQPKTLPCDHIFCKDCLVQHATQNLVTHRNHVEITCPICRETVRVNSKGKFDVEAWAKSLPTDILVGSLMQTLQSHVIETSPDACPKLCEAHGGKTRDAYCFTHAQLLCWECAARQHRSCNVDSVDKARHAMQPEVVSMKKIVEIHLAKARELTKSEQAFTVSKTSALNDLQVFENRLDRMFESAKHQVSLLRSDIDDVTKRHLDERKQFYDVITSLLECHCSLEMLASEESAINVIGVLGSLKREIEDSVRILQKLGKDLENAGEQRVKFVVDQNVLTFLSIYSSIGFVDSNVPGTDDGVTSTPPQSLSHILMRSSSLGATNNS